MAWSNSFGGFVLGLIYLVLVVVGMYSLATAPALAAFGKWVPILIACNVGAFVLRWLTLGTELEVEDMNTWQSVLNNVLSSVSYGTLIYLVVIQAHLLFFAHRFAGYVPVRNAP